VPLFLTVGAGWPLGHVLSRVTVTPTPVAAAITAFITLAAFTLMLSQTLSSAVDALYERADLDLLFSSPLDPARVMFVRFLAVAASVFWIFGYFLTGPLVAIAVQGHLPWLAALVVLFALALASAGAGLLLASALFRLIGPRRTRTVAQIMAAVIGAAFFLTAQARNILGQGQSETAMVRVMRLARDPHVQIPGLDWPLRAMLGEPLPLLAVVAAGAAIFGLAAAILGPKFAADAAAAAGAGRGVTGRKRVSFGAFAEGAFVTTLRKELRLLLRDPALLTQVLMRVLYMLPLGFLLLRQAGRGDELLVPGSAAALSLMAGQWRAAWPGSRSRPRTRRTCWPRRRRRPAWCGGASWRPRPCRWRPCSRRSCCRCW
jgi:ABC-2 type transport system permease protein